MNREFRKNKQLFLDLDYDEPEPCLLASESFDSCVEWDALPDAEELRDEGHVTSLDTGLSSKEIHDMLKIAEVESKHQKIAKIKSLISEINDLSQQINNKIAAVNTLALEMI